MINSFSIVGTGRVGSHLAGALVFAGFAPALYVSRSGLSSERLARSLTTGSEVETLAVSINSVTRIPGDVVFVCVPDDDLPGIVAELDKKDAFLPDQIVFHTSGGLTSLALSSIKHHGRAIGSFHPLQTFVSYDSDVSPDSGSRDQKIFCDLPIAVEGDRRAVEAGFVIADALGGKPFGLSSESKLLYHAAAVVSSNFITTIVGSVKTMLEAISDHPGMSIELFKPLVETAVENVFSKGPEDALTGPVVRGDLDLLKSHLNSIASKSPESLLVYVVLSRETLRLSRKAERISEETASAIEDVLNSYSHSSGHS